ncbi:MAG TPA: thioesterase family protein [Dehalococcoidia bacterium]|jgi:predicted thioesterase|nr:thioesterase family protein [Dehalococcoidia bacterium]
MVSPNIQPGLKGQRHTMVCEHNVAPHVDKFSTPSMIRLMEQASSEAVAEYLEEGQVTVGFEVNVRHLAPADIGETITAYAEMTEIDRNRVTFKVEAYEGERKIGEGTHRRGIITPNRSKMPI